MSIKNNNPGNLVYVESIKWQGLASPPNDGRFCSFVSAIFGIRALAVNLISYQDRDNCRTIEQIINRWAPSTENDTQAYVADVVARTGYPNDFTLDLHTYAHLSSLVQAIIWHENGSQPYSAAQIAEALKMAGVIQESKPLIKDPKIIAGSLITAATTAQQVVANTQGIWTSLNQMGIGATSVMIVLGCVAASVGVWFLLDALKARKEGRA